MRRRPLLAVYVLIGLTALTMAPLGCSSTSLSPDAGQTCDSLLSAYETAFAAAQSCDPSLATDPCTEVVSATLQCPSCQTHVTSTTQLDAIAAVYNARTDCPRLPCPHPFCPSAGTGACAAIDSGPGLGTCINVH